MKYEFKSSFDRSVKSLPSEKKQEVKELCIALIDVLSGELKDNFKDNPI
jgi:mRNA-degrading endonuclease YafQ of YafQ-DinJ toxin-antitoxin module